MAARSIRVYLRSAYRHESGESSPSPLAIEMLRLMVEAHRRVAKKSAAFTFIDLFAGTGGLRIGFEGMGGKYVLTGKWDKYSVETYRKSFPESASHVFASDIREFTKDARALGKIPAHDVLLAGFPCQPFSIPVFIRKTLRDG